MEKNILNFEFKFLSASATIEEIEIVNKSDDSVIDTFTVTDRFRANEFRINLHVPWVSELEILKSNIETRIMWELMEGLMNNVSS